MICDEVYDALQAYIQKEVDGEKRIEIFKHLQNCGDCKDAFLEQLKIYYTLEREKVLTSQPEIKPNFKQDIIDTIDIKDSTKIRFQKKWIWYAAAAILICGIIIGRYTIPTIGQNSHSKLSDHNSISRLIENESWNQLQCILANQDQFSKYANEELDIKILIKKLVKLQNYSQTIPNIRISSGQTNKSEQSKNRSPIIEISVNDFIDLLEQIKQRRSEITLEEVSAILMDI